MASPFPGKKKEPREIKKGPIIFLAVFVGLIVWMVLSIRNTISEPLTPREQARLEPVFVKPKVPFKRKDDSKPMNISEMVVNQMMNGKPLKIEYGGTTGKPQPQGVLPGSRVPSSNNKIESPADYYPDQKGGK
jgi:hypothetical protein